MKRPSTPQPLSMIEAILPIAGLIVLVGTSYLLFGDAGAAGPNQVALVMASLIATFLAWRRGHDLNELREAAIASCSSGLGAIFILFAVGALIGTWAMSGTLLAMVYYGLQLLSPNFFYVATTIICAIVSASIGSSWTVVGTIGIGLMGISLNMGLDPGISAAAIISGAYFGDTTSPLSDSTNLASAAAEVDLYDHISETVITSGLALAIAVAVFWFLGRPGDFDATEKMASIQSTMNVSPVLFLPVVIVIVMAVMKVSPFTTIMMGALSGGLIAVFVAPERVVAFADQGKDLPAVVALIKGVWLALASGYVSTTGHATIDVLVSRGGMDSMLNTVWLILTALAFGGIVEKIGILEQITAPILRAARSTGALVSALVGAVFTTNIVTADQYIAIVLPGRIFKNAFAGRGLAPVVLSRTVGASATPTSALIPWNSCGAYMAATLGVSTWAYLPYAVFNFASPLLLIAMAYAGVRIRRIDTAPATADREPTQQDR